MIAMRALRAHKHYASLFDYVPALLWPILWWQLNLMIRWMRDAKVSDVCFQTNIWGFITIRHVAYQPDPSLYRPAERTFRELSDPSWASGTPVCLGSDGPIVWHRLILPREAGGGGSLHRRLTEGAFAPTPNTS